MKGRVMILSILLLSIYSASGFAQTNAFQKSLLRSNLAQSYNLKLSGDDSAGGDAMDETPSWIFEFTPYGWLAGLSGDINVGNVTVKEIDLPFSDIVSNLDMTFMGHFEANHDRWTILADIVYNNLSDKPNTVAVRIKNTIFETGLAYHISENFEVLGGVRINKEKVELTPTPLTSPLVEKSKTFADPFFGARVQGKLNEKWAVFARGDIGGFGVGSQISENITTGVIWRIARMAALDFGYRWLHFDLGKDNDVFQTDLTYKGPFAAITFFF